MLIYKCSICSSGGFYSTKSQWLNHLIQKEHQKLARRELLSWSEGVRARVIVVFANVKHPVGRNSKIVEKLSKDGETVVSDFVWWEERPWVGFVQFESRETLIKVVASLEDKQFQIYDQVCQVMDGGTIAEPEWRTLFPDNLLTNPCNHSDDQNEGTRPKRIKLEPVEVDETFEEETGTSSSLGRSEINDNANLTLTRHDSRSNNNPDQTVAVSLEPVIKLEPIDLEEHPNDFGLRHHLAAIRKLIEIPDEEYNIALDIFQTFQRALADDESRGGPRIRAFLSQHWILKLQYCANKDFRNIECEITISCVKDKDPTNGKWLNLKKLKHHIKQIFNKRGSSQHFPQYIVEAVDTEQNLRTGKTVQSYRFTSRQDPGRQLPISMILFQEGGYSVEVQVWKLAKYLCTFDPRCHPVLSLLYYWAQTNSVTVGQKYDRGIQKDLADPCGLTWLLIFFFQWEGLIPSTKEIQEQRHKPVSKKGIDIGFTEDPDYPMAWKITRTPRTDKLDEGDEKFAVVVFQLLYKFFRFCDTQLGGATMGNGLLLNTREAEIVPLMDGSRNSSPDVIAVTGTNSNSKLKGHDMNEIKASCGTDMLEPILMLNPFMLKCKISMVNAKQAFVSMKKTAMQMNEYFDFEEGHYSAGAAVKREKLELEEFLKLLDIQS